MKKKKISLLYYSLLSSCAEMITKNRQLKEDLSYNLEGAHVSGL